jgi:chemotaxis protein MotB
MASGRRQAKSEDAPQGAPEWMVTFSDCMTLLLTFFVLLLSFSSFDEKVLAKLSKSVLEHMPTVNAQVQRTGDAFLRTDEIQPTDELDKGSEKPTLAERQQVNQKQETEPVDFRKRKVFLVPSKRIFLGRGTAMSRKGRKVLGTVAQFLEKVPGRVVVSENGPDSDRGAENSGLQRAWEVVDYLTAQGVERGRFSITSTSTLAQESVETVASGDRSKKDQRVLEIVMLERRIYN